MGSKITKNGIVQTSGSGVNNNMCVWGYSRKPLFSGAAGNTVLSVTEYDDFMRYTATTAGSNGGRYGYPVGASTTGVLVQGNKYIWSCDIRSSVNMTGTTNTRLGMEGGGMLSSTNVVITTEWKHIVCNWTQTTSYAFVLYPAGALANGQYIDIKNLKVEAGWVATPYIPNPADPNYTGNGDSLFETGLYPAKIGNDWVQVSNFIEI